MNPWAVLWFAAWGGFILGWILGRKEMAHWFVRSNDGPGCEP